MIDTLKYSRELEAAGFTPEQAELFVRSQINMITDNVATRIDMRDISHRIDKMDQKFEARFVQMEEKFIQIEEKFETRFVQLEEKFETQLKSLESRFDLKLDRKLEQMTNKLGIIVVSSMGLMITGLGVFQKFF